MLEIAEGAAVNLMVLSAVFAAGFLLGCGAGRFLRQPKKEQEKKVKAWLLWAVTSAEQEMQGAPGRLKLRRVYDMFVQRFPAMALAVPWVWLWQTPPGPAALLSVMTETPSPWIRTAI